MKHTEVIYRYANAGARAKAFGLNLSASRDAFVLRFQKSMQVFGWPCADVEELERLLSNAALLRSLAFCGVALDLPAAQQWPAQKREKDPARVEAQTGIESVLVSLLEREDKRFVDAFSPHTHTHRVKP